MRVGLSRARSTQLSLVLALAGLAGCAPDIAAPFSAVVVAWDPGNQAYELAQVQITTVTSLRSMQGTSGNVESGGTVRLYTQETEAQGASVSQLRSKAFLSPPGAVALEFNTANGLVYPEDFDALELLSFYGALEKSRAEIGVWGFSDLPPSPIFAEADLRNEAGLSPLAEGELFLEPLNAFFLPALSAQQQIPPQMNLGVVAHAVGLQAWQQIVWSGAPADPAYAIVSTDTGALAAIHLAQSIRIGIGDFLGTLLTEDPHWFAHSLPQTASARDLGQVRCGSSAMLQALDVPDDEVPYDPYPLGTVLAFSLWDSALNADPTAVATAVVGSLPAIGAAQSANGGKLDLVSTLDAIVAAASANAQVQGVLCGELLNGFHALGVTDIPTCDSIGIIAAPESCQ